MGSDSWLSKNIRPMTLIFLLFAYSAFAVASIFDYETRGAYVELLGQWGMLVMSFYFGGRTMEKIADEPGKSTIARSRNLVYVYRAIALIFVLLASEGDSKLWWRCFSLYARCYR